MEDIARAGARSSAAADPEIDIHRKNLVFDLEVGTTLRYKALKVDYTYVRRSQEFEPPSPPGHAVHRFGSIALSWNWKS
jgi:hypothetical protein